MVCSSCKGKGCKARSLVTGFPVTGGGVVTVSLAEWGGQEETGKGLC